MKQLFYCVKHMFAPKEEYNSRTTRTRSELHAPRSSHNIMKSWKNRLMEGVQHQDFANQVALYGSHRTVKDYLCNALGQACMGLMFPLLTILVSQICGCDSAGQFSMAFVVASVFQFIALFGVRTFQVSDVSEQDSFAAYQLQRILTCIIMAVISWVYLTLRHDSELMSSLLISLMTFKLVDSLADVYEGRLQQCDKLYLAGISQAIRCGGACFVFMLVLILFRDVQTATRALTLFAGVSFVIITYPLAKFETPKSRGWEAIELSELFYECFPAFLGQFLFALIDTSPKFIMEAILDYQQQLYFNALYFPAMAIVLVAALVYKPQLMKLSMLWTQSDNTKRFDTQTFIIATSIIGITVLMAFIMWNWGATLNGILYGVSFKHLQLEQLGMVIAGGLSACIDFFFQLLTIIRKQANAFTSYLISFGFVIICSLICITTLRFSGAVGSYVGAMILLCMLLCLQYVHARKTIQQH
ncbi:lipopolysaccharide biosynthesis protein [Fannyhessea vaginae]|uniref:lipopolysaccharide biosynthesis protein n=1 Tax=Fannyhessea vaginae TaxID=82135 RepID=UPI0023F350DE|nr:polysaccharide biosynthesis protein [Fannyhessea vaginae]